MEAPTTLPAPLPLLSRRETCQIALYFGLLTLFSGVGSGLVQIPLLFFLKNQFKLGPQQMAIFQVIAAIPAYVGFLFGFLRDRWRPFGMGDRGYILLMPPALAATNVWLACAPLTYSRLVIASLIGGVFSLMLGAAIRGLMTSVAQGLAMTGRLTALFLVINGVPGIISSVAGGWLESRVPPATVFLIAAGLVLVLSGLAFWRPTTVFDLPGKWQPRLPSEDAMRAVRRLVRHRPLYPAAAILLLWNLCPGWGTPLFFYLTNTVKLSSEGFGQFNGMASICGIAASLGYGLLCQRWPLRRLLWGTAVLSIATNLAFLAIHNLPQALLVGGMVGTLCASAFASFNDLYTRSCPRGLEGAAILLSGAFMAAGWVVSDLFGSWLYEKGGFGLALGVSMAMNTMILGVLLLTPHHLVATRDGEALLAQEAQSTLAPLPVAA